MFEHRTLFHSSFLCPLFFSSTQNKIEKNAYVCVNPWNAMTHPIALSCSVCHAVALRAGSESL